MNLNRYIRDRTHPPAGGCRIVRTAPADRINRLLVRGSGTATQLDIDPLSQPSTRIGGAATLAALAVAIGRALPAEHRRAIIEHLGGREKGRGT